MIASPIRKVLSSLRRHRVSSLLMGGQACVLYGAAEFSRDTDLVVPAQADNVQRLAEALQDLHAEVIAVPPFELQYLERGHAIPFRCLNPELLRMRVDIMSRMRNVDAFDALWGRRTTIELPDDLAIDLLSLPDLVNAKKTQRDKDWPMIRRLIEVNYFENRHDPTEARVLYWLAELRTPELLIELAMRFPELAKQVVQTRPLLRHAMDRDEESLPSALADEEYAERKKDRMYWKPLKEELQSLRERRYLP